MSRRREAAELAKALLLSTQEATLVSKLSPHTLSSSKSGGTQNSKDMELRPYDPRYRGMEMSTVRPGDIMAPPIESGIYRPSASSGSGTKSSRDPITSRETGSNPTSNIQSFTPSHTHTNNHPAAGIPARSGSHHPSHSSNAHVSSPMLPPPQSRPASNGNSHTTSESSHRPLFSPTQLTNNPSAGMPTPPIAADVLGSKPNAQAVRTYGKTGSRGVTPVQETVIVLSSSPDAAPTPRRAAAQRKRVIDNSSDQEVEEQIEDTRPPRLATRTPHRVEIVLPSRDRSKPKTAGKRRPTTPDPLDALDRHTLDTLPFATRIKATPSASPLKSSRVTSSVAPDPETQQSIVWIDPSTRQSSRIKTSVEKRQVEDAERRRKRKEEKLLRRHAEEAAGLGETVSRSKVRQSDEKARKSAEDDDAYETPSRHTAEGSHRSSRRSANVLDSLREAKTPSMARVTAKMDDTGEVVPSKSAPIVVEKSVSLPAKRNEGKKRRQVEEDEDELGSWEEAAQDVALAPGPSKKKPAKERRPKARANGKQKATDTPAVVKEPIPEVEEDVAEDVIQPEAEADAVDQDEETTAPGDNTTAPAEDAPEPPPERPPLRTTSYNIVQSVASASHRPSPGPRNANGSFSKPDGIKWKTSRSDLSSVLARFPGAKHTGMSKRLQIVPLHAKIGPGVKALPPAPQKPQKKKKGEESEDEEDMSEDENGNPKKKSKVKGMEWYMVED